MPDISTKPYLIRAILEWCADSGFTPYIAVAVDDSVSVPGEFVKNGEIVLNVSTLATSRLVADNDKIQFQARFSGTVRDVFVPIPRILAVYARENGQGMAFDVPRSSGASNSGDEAVPPRGAVGREPGTRSALSVVESLPAAETGGAPDGPDSPLPPTAGDRPKLKRIK